jgi:hypothetical protein
MAGENDLYRLAVEHTMRITDDEPGAWVLISSPRGSQEMLVALGRLLATTSTPLTPGSPLVCWATGEPGPVPGWRDALPENPSSLWSRLEFLRTITDPAETGETEHDLALLLALEDAAGMSITG